MQSVTPEKAANLTQYRRAVYDVRDILSCAANAPDKIRSRTLLTWASQARRAAPVAYGFLRNLRGRLVACESSDEKLWCVASIDGTDPNAMPPEKGKWLVAALFNDHPQPRDVELDLAAPSGTTFQARTVERIDMDPSTYDFAPHSEAAPAGGNRRSFRLTLPANGCWKVALPLQGEPPTSSQVRRKQFFSPDILQAVGRDKPLATAVKIDPAMLKAARRAWLRLVVEDIADGEATVAVNGRDVPLPKAVTDECETRTVMLPVAPADLSPETTFAFRVNAGNFAGYRVDMTSVVVEMPGAADR